MSIYRIGPK